jgi:hypothetical protein
LSAKWLQEGYIRVDHITRLSSETLLGALLLSLRVLRRAGSRKIRLSGLGKVSLPDQGTFHSERLHENIITMRNKMVVSWSTQSRIEQDRIGQDRAGQGRAGQGKYLNKS